MLRLACFAALCGIAVLTDLLAQDPAAATPRTTASRTSRPNFVFLLAEGTGAGWNSLSVAMDDRLPEAKSATGLTPHLEQLAAEGMRMPSFYVSAPRCTPARATLLTGIGAARLHMTYVNESGSERRGGGRRRGAQGETEPAAEGTGPGTRLLPPSSVSQLPRDLPTIASVLKEVGYATAHLGKWHVGRLAPGNHGFDLDDGANTNQGPGREPKPNPEQGTAITDRGIEFMRAQVAGGKPFYLQLSHYGGGSEDEVRAETRQALAAQLRGMRGKTAWQAGILADVDANLGRVLAALDELGIADSTYVVFSTDHGMAGRNSNLPLQGGKGSVMEGGVRVPFLVRGPGIPKGSQARVLASGADLLPTLADLAGVQRMPSGIEGGSLAAVWKDPAKGTVQRPREEFVVHFPHYDLGSAPASAIWLGDHKLVWLHEDDTLQLFDLAKDPGERRDLAREDPKRVADLKKRLDAYLKDIDAAMPQRNPAHGK